MVASRRPAVVWAVAAVVAGSALLAAGCAAPPAAPATPVSALVTVEQGPVQGYADGSVLRYKGLPYAAPPVGDRRWTPPAPAARWTGTRDAARPAARCAQLAAAPGIPHRTAASTAEDCLTVDVTVPAGTTTASKLPVLVWLHGGAFSAGAAGDVDPRRLAAAGPLVVVTVNYRLGILGFLGLPGLAGSGAFGLLDQQAALRWVARNVAAFGGDPRRVTLGGESAGADSACGQLAAPGSVGLFQQVILQSGGCLSANLHNVVVPGTGSIGDTWKPLPLVEAAGSRAAPLFGCPDPATALACLRHVPAAKLVPGAGTYWSPATGTSTLPPRPSDLVAYGDLRPVPMLAGTNRDEGTLFTAAFYDNAGRPLDDATFRPLLASTTVLRAAEVGAAYPAVDRTPGRAWSDVITDRAYACPALANYTVLGTSAPLYAYEFDDPTAPSPYAALPRGLAAGVTHGAEMAYLFDLVPGQPAFTPAQQAAADRLVGAWARFVTTGSPASDEADRDGPDGTGGWPRWSGGGTILSITDTGGTAIPAAAFSAEHHCGLWGG
jgi:para-nitrobenzyl esterase